MPRYTHCFDVRIAQSFESDIEDFEEAFEAWAAQFKTSSELRTALLSSDESTKSIIQGLDYSDTHDSEEEQQDDT